MQSIVTLLLFAASPDAGTAATEQPVNAKPVKEKKVCRNVVATGTRLGKRECKTQAQWDMVDRDLGTGRGGARNSD